MPANKEKPYADTNELAKEPVSIQATAACPLHMRWATCSQLDVSCWRAGQLGRSGGQVTHREQARHGRARFLQHKARARAPDAGNRLAGVRLVQQLLAALRYLLSLLRVNCTEYGLVMIMHSDSQVAGLCYRARLVQQLLAALI